MEFVTNIIFFLVLLLLGYIFGAIAEKKHFKSIRTRERRLRHIMTFSKRFPHADIEQQRPVLVDGNIVVSVDYFKRVVAGLRNLVGGRVSSYDSLLERARREAILRMKEKAEQLNAETIVNVKLETASITKGRGSQIGCVEVYAYGTALIASK